MVDVVYSVVELDVVVLFTGYERIGVLVVVVVVS